MRQYCRYCAFCFEADAFRCSNHPEGKQPNWSEKDIKKENHCPNFELSDLGDVITGKQYHPRESYEIHSKPDWKQITLGELFNDRNGDMGKDIPDNKPD